MFVKGVIRPDFLIIGAQRGGTTWLWTTIRQHPGTSLPKRKEIHFFGTAEEYRKGTEWYYDHFKALDRSKVVGEGSTTYLYDRVPYAHNNSDRLEFDTSLPSVAELVTQELPSAKVLAILRDPVSRAVSAYSYWMRRVSKVSPLLGLKETALRYPKMRILEYGYYARYLRTWQEYLPAERMRILVFEEDVVREPGRTMRAVYEFLGLDPDFLPPSLNKPEHRSWTWTRILFRYLTRPMSPRLSESRIGAWFDRHDFLGRLAVRSDDIDFLRSHYLPEKAELESLLNRSLNCWQYGRTHAER